MPSSNKTENFNLNLWDGSDRPMRNDFNNDNSVIDSVLGTHVNDSNIHVTAEEKAYLQDSHQTYTYTGNGEASRTFTLTEGFRFIAVFAKDKSLASGYGAFGYIGLGASTGLSISASGKGFTVSAGLNENGVQYKVVMFK